MAGGATEIPAPAEIKQVVRYLYDRSRSLPGGWVSVADLRGALSIDLEMVRAACRTLHDRKLAELMGGFPIRPTTDRFTLVRLSEEGVTLASDPQQLDERFGSE